jgi:hypothetical protein
VLHRTIWHLRSQIFCHHRHFFSGRCFRAWEPIAYAPTTISPQIHHYRDRNLLRLRRLATSTSDAFTDRSLRIRSHHPLTEIALPSSTTDVNLTSGRA